MLSGDSAPEITGRLDAVPRSKAVVDLLCWQEVASLETDWDLAGLVAAKVAANLGVQTFDEAPRCAMSELAIREFGNRLAGSAIGSTLA